MSYSRFTVPAVIISVTASSSAFLKQAATAAPSGQGLDHRPPRRSGQGRWAMRKSTQVMRSDIMRPCILMALIATGSVSN